MGDKELIEYIIDNEYIAANIQYQNLIHTLGYVPTPKSISVIEKTLKVMVNLTYIVDSENYMAFKKALWFGQIIMNVFNGSVKPPFIFVVTLKLDKTHIGLLTSFDDADSQKIDFYQAGNQIVNKIDGLQEDVSCRDSGSVTCEGHDTKENNNCNRCNFY